MKARAAAFVLAGLILLLALAILLAPLAAAAQQPGQVYRIGFLRRTSPQPSDFEAFRRGLRELGYIEGQNIAIEQRYAVRADQVIE